MENNGQEFRAQVLGKRYARMTGALFAQKGIKGKVAKVTRGARYLALGVRLENPLTLDVALGLAEPLALACRTPAVIVQRSEADPGLVAFQFQLAQRFWKSYTRRDVRGLGLGVGEGNRQIDFAFDPAHAGFFGTTGSGKSETIRSLLAGLFLAESPADLGAVVVDPHRDFDDLANCAHLVAPIAHDRGETGEALAWVSQELARRKETNERDGKRLVVVVDEAASALADERALAVARAVAAEARKYRIHLVVGSQDAKEKELPGLVRLINNRWVGLVANAAVSAQLTGQVGLGCHQLTGAGDFVHVAGATVERLQVARATARDLEKLPRVVEVPRPEVDPEETPEVLEARQPGRPPNELQARHVAAYLFYGNISIRDARETLGLSKRNHRRHKAFALEVQRGLEYLRRQDGQPDR